jgi:hypothetical protein
MCLVNVLIMNEYLTWTVIILQLTSFSPDTSPSTQEQRCRLWVIKLYDHSLVNCFDIMYFMQLINVLQLKRDE